MEIEKPRKESFRKDASAGYLPLKEGESQTDVRTSGFPDTVSETQPHDPSSSSSPVLPSLNDSVLKPLGGAEQGAGGVVQEPQSRVRGTGAREGGGSFHAPGTGGEDGEGCPEQEVRA